MTLTDIPNINSYKYRKIRNTLSEIIIFSETLRKGYLVNFYGDIDLTEYEKLPISRITELGEQVRVTNPRNFNQPDRFTNDRVNIQIGKTTYNLLTSGDQKMFNFLSEDESVLASQQYLIHSRFEGERIEPGPAPAMLFDNFGMGTFNGRTIASSGMTFSFGLHTPTVKFKKR